MKKIKNLFLVLFCVFYLVSCSTNNSNVSNGENNDNINNSTNDYISVDVNVTESNLAVTDIETAVENIYDSVVAVDSYVGNSLAGSGSGVLFGSDNNIGLSFIVTCHHVIDSSSSFTVTLSNNKAYEAKLVGGDVNSDIAVLSIEEVDLTYASWYSDTNNLKLGSTVICIGNPLGSLPGSVSTGVVSYNNRKVNVDYQVMELIQTDVAINSGNSGGGLFNGAGALIGIVNAKYASSGIEGLGFAIPSNKARSVVESILKTAEYSVSTKSWKTGYLEGVWALGATFDLFRVGFMSTCVAVSSISTNTTTSDYGLLQLYDQIESVSIKYADGSNGSSLSKVSTVDELYSYIYGSNLSIGDKLIFNVIHNNSNTTSTIEITLKQYRYYI